MVEMVMSNDLQISNVGELITQTEWFSTEVFFLVEQEGWIPVRDNNGNRIPICFSSGSESILCYLYYKIMRINGDSIYIGKKIES